MPSLTLRFATDDVIILDGATLESGGARRTYDETAVAMVAFEANAQAREQAGLRGEPSCSDELPGILGDIGCDDDRSWIKIRDGRLVAVHLYDADPVGYWDGLRGSVQAAAPLDRFTPATAPFETLGVHALRRLLAHPATATCPRFGCALWGPYIDPLLDRLLAAGRGAWLSHLWLYDPWNSNKGELNARPRPLGTQFPSLRMLYAPYWSWPMWSGAPLPGLTRLTLGHGPEWIAAGKGAPPLPPLAQVLDEIAARAPRLAALSLPHRRWDEAGLHTLTRHPLLASLQILELYNVHHDLDYEALLAARPRLSHLSRLILGSHLVPQTTMARFADWPAVTFAAHDRRELVEFDREWRDEVA
jgi:hypothetical protein